MVVLTVLLIVFNRNRIIVTFNFIWRRCWSQYFRLNLVVNFFLLIFWRYLIRIDKIGPRGISICHKSVILIVSWDLDQDYIVLLLLQLSPSTNPVRGATCFWLKFFTSWLSTLGFFYILLINQSGLFSGSRELRDFLCLAWRIYMSAFMLKLFLEIF